MVQQSCSSGMHLYIREMAEHSSKFHSEKVLCADCEDRRAVRFSTGIKQLETICLSESYSPALSEKSSTSHVIGCSNESLKITAADPECQSLYSLHIMSAACFVELAPHPDA